MPTPIVPLSLFERHTLLNELANFLDDLPHSKFYIPTWASQDFTEISCGQAGCVGGWAATIHHRFGLSLFAGVSAGDPTTRAATLAFGDPTDPIEIYNRLGSAAFAQMYGIDRYLASWITTCIIIPGVDPHSGKPLPSYCEEYALGEKTFNVTPAMAADRIRKVLARVGFTPTSSPSTPPVALSLPECALA